MAKIIKMLTAISLILALTVTLFTGCGSAAPADFAVEPFDLEWGITQQEAEALLKCVYCTNAKEPDTVYVINGDNGGTLEAFGTKPSLIIYSFNVTQSGSSDAGLGEITVYFPKEDYDAVLAYLDGKCGERYFEDTQWGTADSNVFLFEEGIVSIKYSSNPLTDPEKIDTENRDRYIALSGMSYSSQQTLAAGYQKTFALLWMYSTAETDFVRVDNTQ